MVKTLWSHLEPGRKKAAATSNKIVKNKPKEVKHCTLNITNPDERN